VGVQSATVSWRLVQSVEQLLHVALYTRAVLDLPTAAGAPPPLRGGPAPVPALLGGDPAPAARAWEDWWDDQVALTALLRGADRASGSPPTPPTPAAPAAGAVGGPPAGSGQDADRWAGWNHWRGRVLRAPAGPPDYDGLHPLLRPAAVTTWRAANTWTTLHARGLRQEHTELAPGVAATAAAAVAFDHTITLGEVHGLLLPLAVTGIWWTQWAPGIVLCSFDALTDPTTARAVAYTTLAGPHRT